MCETKTVAGGFAEAEADIYTGADLPEYPEGLADALSDLEKTVSLFHRRYGDYRFIPGADVVVTPQGLEDAAKDVYLMGWQRFGDGNPVPWSEHDEEVRGHYRAVVRAAITAAGGVVADEVVEVQVFAGDDDVYVSVPSRDGEESYVELHDGDILHITRKENTRDQS